MKPKILITGPPRCGKSTLISKLIEHFTQKNRVIHGFFTPEVRKNSKRIGFDVEDIFSGEKVQLARINDFERKYRVGKYSVFINDFENYLERLFKLEDKSADLLIIDEIGKMELFSQKFQDLLKSLFNSNITIIATLGLKLKHPFKNYILTIPRMNLFSLSRQNFENTYRKIISIIT